MKLLHALAAVGLGSGIALGGYRKGALTADGAVAAAVVGASTFGFGGLTLAAALVVFFVSGSALSRRPRVPGEVRAAKGHRRDAAQVLANGGVTALAAGLAAAGYERATGAALGALAAASGDTWASELGVFSPSYPRSILTGRTVRPGTSGGVTPLGWTAAATGALLVGLAYAAVGRGLPDRRRAASVALVAGLAGSLADSLAGATTQAAYRCQVCSAPAEAPGEHCGAPIALARGQVRVTNDVVNLLCTATGGLVGALLWPSNRR